MALAGAPQASRFLRAALGHPPDVTPVWFMRQAGRYLPEYRAIRSRLGLLEICARPEVVAEVTLQPVRRLGVDAAILFADLLLPLVPMGLELGFSDGDGPGIRNPVRTPAAVDTLFPVDPTAAFMPVFEAIRLIRRELPDSRPLLGFGGGPFTMASYAIEGGSSRHFAETKRFMYSEPAAWHRLLGRLVEVVGDFLVEQVWAGVSALQVFDTWVGALHPDDYRSYVLPHAGALFERLRYVGVPTIHFGIGAASLLELMAQAGGDLLGLDWRIPLSDAWRRLGPGARLQGNLDPAALLAPRAILEQQVRSVLRQASGRTGYVFNLGHGILPDTPVDQVRAVVDLVHEYRS